MSIVRLYTTKLRKPIDYDNRTKLLRLLPNYKMYDSATILIIKHNDDLYLMKVRPGYEWKLKSNEFRVIYKPNPEAISSDYDRLLVAECIDKCIIFDATGYRVNNVITNEYDLDKLDVSNQNFSFGSY